MTFEDRGGDVEVEMGIGFAVRVALGEIKGRFTARERVGGVEVGFAVHEKSVKRTLVIRFLEGILCLCELI